MNIELSNKSVLVTGGAGFIGSNLCEALIEKENKVYMLPKHLDEKVAMLREQFEALKANQSTSTAGLATAQIEKNRLSPISQDLTLRETILSTELQRLIPQSEATQSVVDQLSFNVSEKTAQIIDEEISNIIETQYKRACDLLKKNKSKLTQLAERLLEKEVIFKDDLSNILGKRPFDDDQNPEKSVTT